MFTKMLAVICMAVLYSVGLTIPANAQDRSSNICPSDHPVQYNLPTDAKNKTDQKHNHQIPGGDYHVEATTPGSVTLCGESWPVYDQGPPKPKPCLSRERSFIIDSSTKHGPESVDLPSSAARVAGYAPSEDKQTVLILLCADNTAQITEEAHIAVAQTQNLMVLKHKEDWIRRTSVLTTFFAMTTLLLGVALSTVLIKRPTRSA